MTRTMIAFLATVALMLASSVTVPAQGRKGSMPKPQRVSSTTTKVSSPKVSSPKTTKASSPKTTKTPSPKTTNAGAKTKTAKGGPKTTTAKATTKTTSSPATKTAKADAKSTTKTAKTDTKATTSENTSTTPATTPGDTETPVTLTKVQERLQKNTKLAERLAGRLPKGADLLDAADGFKNLGHFVAAVNVSSNLGLDFEKIKTAMVDDGRSLGQAIQSVKTDVENPTLVAQRAESEALTLIQQTEKTTATTTTTSAASQKTKSKEKPKRTRTGSGS